jgi:predicted esterase
MNRPRQTIRLRFMIALTVAVALLGIANVGRLQRKKRHADEIVRVRGQAQELAARLADEMHDLADIAHGERCRVVRDAAALYVQVQRMASPDVAQLAALRSDLAQLREGIPKVFPRGKPFLRGYRAESDASFRPYSICVPPIADTGRPMPVIVFLHGHRGFRSGQEGRAPAYAGAITVQPEGRRASDYMYVGEDDVLAVLDDVEALYNVDRRRVYLAGNSMGGTGCWNLAVHYPDRFAGIVSSSGNADHGAWEQLWDWNPPDLKHHRLRAFLHESFSPISYAGNLLHTRIDVAHGTGDAVVPVEHSRSMIDRLRKDGSLAHLEYREFPAAGHGVGRGWQQNALVRVFSAGAAQCGAATEVNLRTTSLRHNRAWWLEVDALDNPIVFSEVKAALHVVREAEFFRDGKPLEPASDETWDYPTDMADEVGAGWFPDRELEVVTGILKVRATNVAGFSLHVDRMLVTLTDVLIGADSAEDKPQRIAVPADAGPRIRLVRRDGKWRIADGAPEGVHKRRGLSGPVSDVFRGAFLLVPGTQGEDELAKAICAQEAERFATDWKRRYGDRPPLKTDVEVTQADVKARSLILFGGPAVNKLSAQIAPHLPVKVTPGAITFEGQRFDAPDVGALLCYPNPLARDRMVVLVAGNSPAALYQAMDRFGLWFNWGIYDKYKWFDFAVFDARTASPETFLKVGFFDNAWQTVGLERSAVGGGYTLPVRKQMAVAQGFPSRMNVEDVDGAELMLSDLLPEEIKQYRGAVGFDRSYAGRAIRLGGQSHAKGLGVKVSSEIAWRLDGSWRRFSAAVGLTPGHKGRKPSLVRTSIERVTFEVWGDGERLASVGPLSWDDEGLSHDVIEADVLGVLELRLVAKSASGATWHYGAAAWGTPKLAR